MWALFCSAKQNLVKHSVRASKVRCTYIKQKVSRERTKVECTCSKVRFTFSKLRYTCSKLRCTSIDYFISSQLANLSFLKWSIACWTSNSFCFSAFIINSSFFLSVSNSASFILWIQNLIGKALYSYNNCWCLVFIIVRQEWFY